MERTFTQFLTCIWLTLLSAGLLWGQISQAQSIPESQWSKSGKGLSILADGNILTTDLANPADNTIYQAIKYDLPGNQVWQSGRLAGTSYLAGKLPNNCYFCVDGYSPIAEILLTTPTPDGGALLLGKEYGTGFTILTKVGADGKQNFRNLVSGDFRLNPMAFDTKVTFDELITSPDGGFLLLVTSADPNGKTVAFLQKYNADFSVAWLKTVEYPTPNPASPDRSLSKGETVMNTPDGGYLLVGYYNTTGVINEQLNTTSGDNLGWVAKVDGQGNVQWQKLLRDFPNNMLFNGPEPASIQKMLTVTDATWAADGNGYALVGIGFSTYLVKQTATTVLEIDGNGDLKRAAAVDENTTKAFIAPYTGADGTKYYAVGNTSLDNGADPQLLKISTANVSLHSLALLAVLARKTFEGPSDGYLSKLDRAGDGSLVFVSTSNQLVKLKVETSPLVISAPTYDCQTGAIQFNVSGGDGSPITYTAPGITRASATDNFGVVEQGLRNDPKTIPITATQSGVSVTYNFDLKAACSGNPGLQPPVAFPIPDQTYTVGQSVYFVLGGYFGDPNLGLPGYIPYWSINASGLPPSLSPFAKTSELMYTPAVVIVGTATATGVYTVTATAHTTGGTVSTTFKITINAAPTNALALVAPDYNCQTGAITFKTTGGDGSPIEYQAAGITGWTTNPNQFVDQESRTALDVQPFVLMARQSGVVVTYTWDLKAACGRARVGIEERGTGLQVRVLGNPIEGKTADVEISGAKGKAVQLKLVDSRGEILHQDDIKEANAIERLSIPTGNAQGILLLQVGTDAEQKKIKLLKP